MDWTYLASDRALGGVLVCVIKELWRNWRNSYGITQWLALLRVWKITTYGHLLVYSGQI